MTEISSAPKTFLEKSGAEEVPLQQSEERAPDRSSLSSSRHADLVCELKLPGIATLPPPPNSQEYQFFVDGVQRTHMLWSVEVTLNGVPLKVPLHGTHLIAGAMQRCGSTLKPYIIRSTKVFLLPLFALREADSAKFSINPGIDLDPDRTESGFIYPELSSGKKVFSDTSLPLHRGEKRIRLTVEDLVKVGDLRRRAFDRAKVLLRILELGLIEELRAKTDSPILVDGPLGPVFKVYRTLVSQNLSNLCSLDDPLKSFDFFSGLSGAVKNVIIIPQEGIGVVLDPNLVRIPVFRFHEVLHEDQEASEDDVYKAILCAFIKLRPELPGLWSQMAGLTRLDIPIPAVLDRSQRAVESWVSETVHNEGDIILLDSEEDKLKEIITSYLSYRWPLPSAFGGRTFTELFAVAEAERWLRSQLLHRYELRRKLAE